MFADEISSQINARRETIQQSLEDAQQGIPIERVPRAAMYATGFAAFALALGVGGWLIYRRSRRRTLVQRLQEALPDSVREMPEGLRARAKARIRTL